MSRFFITIFLPIALLYTPLAKAENVKSKVFVIHSYLPGIWTKQATDGVKAGFLARNITPEIKDYIYDYYSYINLPEAKKASEKNKVLKSIKDFAPDIIIVFDDEAANDLMPLLNTIGLPIVVTAINNNSKDLNWFLPQNHIKRNFTGIWERYPFEQSLRMLKQINPNINEISILTCENYSSKIITAQLVDFFKKHKNVYTGIKLKSVTLSANWEKWKKTISEYKGKDKAFWVINPWNVYDKSGKEVDLRIIGSYYLKHSHLPSLGIASVSQELGFLASFAVSSEDLGSQAAEQAVMILAKNKHPSSIPFDTIRTVRFVINKKRADSLKYKIPIHLLEFGTVEKKIPMQFVR